jgi:hypothetical protein
MEDILKLALIPNISFATSYAWKLLPLYSLFHSIPLNGTMRFLQEHLIHIFLFQWIYKEQIFHTALATSVN